VENHEPRPLIRRKQIGARIGFYYCVAYLALSRVIAELR
jgi:hypothetical protein